MTSRERVRLTLEHKKPDRVPIELGSSSVTGISAMTLDRLRRAYGLEERKIKVHEPVQILGDIDEDLRYTIGTDLIGLWSPRTFMGAKNLGKWTDWNLPNGVEALISEEIVLRTDEKGYQYYHPENDFNARPSLVLPKDGFYFDSIPRQKADLDWASLDARRDFAKDYTSLAEEDLRIIEETSKNFYNSTPYSILGLFGGMTIGDSFILPGTGIIDPDGIRSYEDWMIAYYTNPEYIKEAYEMCTENCLRNLELYKQAVQDRIDICLITGTDFGTQKAPFISEEMWREFYLPYYKRVNDWIHANTNWKIMIHSCGSIYKLLGAFVDAGFDVLNPIQTSAADMDPQRLKDEFGDKFVFIGGGIDTQRVLPKGTPEEVKTNVKERLEIFSKGGGYIFNTIHNIQTDVPEENLIAMFDAVHEFNGV